MKMGFETLSMFKYLIFGHLTLVTLIYSGSQFCFRVFVRLKKVKILILNDFNIN